MDVPSPQAGTVKEVRIKVGDNVSEGTVLVMLEPQAAAPAPAPAQAAAPAPAPAAAPAPAPVPAAAPAPAPAAAGGTVEVKVPDIGDYKGVPVIEIHVKPGDVIRAEDAVVTLESDKATMDVLTPVGGTVKEVKVKIGDEVAEGTLLLIRRPPAQPRHRRHRWLRRARRRRLPPACRHRPPRRRPLPWLPRLPPRWPRAGWREWQGRARQPLGAQVRARAGRGRVARAGHRPEGPHHPAGRAELRQGRDERPVAAPAQAAPAAAGGGELNLLPWPKVDFTRFGEVESKPPSRIKKISARTCTATG